MEQGQPEVEDSLGLPSDEESYNDLKAQFALGLPLISGTRYYISDSFPGNITRCTVIWNIITELHNHVSDRRIVCAQRFEFMISNYYLM